MSRPLFYNLEPKEIRNTLARVRKSAEQMQMAEKKFIEELYEIDQNRFYVWLGFRSLKGYCIHFLKLGRTQSQRIVTQVRRFDPTVNIEQKHEYQSNESLL